MFKSSKNDITKNTNGKNHFSINLTEYSFYLADA